MSYRDETAFFYSLKHDLNQSLRHMNISQEVDLSPNHIEFSEDPKTTACLKYTLHLLMVLLLTNCKSHLPCLYHLSIFADRS